MAPSRAGSTPVLTVSVAAAISRSNVTIKQQLVCTRPTTRP